MLLTSSGDALLAGHLAREAEQIVHQRFGAPGLFANFFRQASGPFRDRRIVGQQLGISEDGRKRIVDFVRRASDQLADGCQFFRLHKLRLQPLEVVEGFLRRAQQAEPFTIDQFVPEKNERTERQNRAERQQNSELVDGHGRLTALQAPEPDQWK